MEVAERLLLMGGRIIDPTSGLDEVADLWISNGKIEKIEQSIWQLVGYRSSPATEGVKVIDAVGKIVIPGLIDMHVHLREPGREDEETVESGTDAAAAGGFTGVACMANTQPAIDNPELVRFVLQKARQGRARVYPIAAITYGLKGTQLTDMAALSEAGAVAFSDDGQSVEDTKLMIEALNLTKSLGRPLLLHEEVKTLTEGAFMNEGDLSRELGVKGMPKVAEDIMVARDIMLAEYTGSPIHIAHISSARSVRFVREAKERGIQVTSEVLPHHFTLTDDAIRTWGANAKMSPPLRTLEDIDVLKQGLADGTIDVIATDHAPHSPDEKDCSLEKAAFGIIGLETTLGLVMTELVEPGVLTLSEVVRKMSLNPARILGVEGGSLSLGSVADITIIDPDIEWLVEPQKFRSKSRNTPFAGRKLRGRAVMTIVGGELHTA